MGGITKRFIIGKIGRPNYNLAPILANAVYFFHSLHYVLGMFNIVITQNNLKLIISEGPRDFMEVGNHIHTFE